MTAQATTQTLKMFPSMNHLPDRVIRAAAGVASGVEISRLGFSLCGEGVYTRAYANDEYVVKGTSVTEIPQYGTAGSNILTWLEVTEKVRARSRVFRQMSRKYIVQTVVLFDTVVVQERTPHVAVDIGDDLDHTYPYRSFEVSVWRGLVRLVEDLASMLGIGDMHEGNFGFTDDLRLKMFDIHPSNEWTGNWHPRNDMKLKMIDQHITMYVRNLCDLNIL